MAGMQNTPESGDSKDNFPMDEVVSRHPKLCAEMLGAVHLRAAASGGRVNLAEVVEGIASVLDGKGEKDAGTAARLRAWMRATAPEIVVHEVMKSLNFGAMMNAIPKSPEMPPAPKGDWIARWKGGDVSMPPEPSPFLKTEAPDAGAPEDEGEAPTP